MDFLDQYHQNLQVLLCGCLAAVLVACEPPKESRTDAAQPQSVDTDVAQRANPELPSTEPEDTLPAIDPFEAAEVAFENAVNLMAEDKFREAIPQLKKSLEFDDQNEEAHYRLAFAFARIQQPEEAIKHYRSTLELTPDYAEAHNNLGNLLMRQGDLPAATTHFNRAIEIAPDIASVHNNLGTVLSRQTRINKAIPHFVKALELDPGYVEAHCNLGNAYLFQKRAQEAAETFQRALQIRPGFPHAIKGLQRAQAQLTTSPR